MQWNRHEKELLSSHGYSKNQLCLWKYPSLAKVGELTGHQGRCAVRVQKDSWGKRGQVGREEAGGWKGWM